MKFTIAVGGTEKSRIEFSRNSFTGAMTILVNGMQVAQEDTLARSTHLSITTTRRYEFIVGRVGRHHIVVEKKRPWLLAAFRPHTYRVFVDRQLCHQQKGY